jgi:hypothetical protein
VTVLNCYGLSNTDDISPTVDHWLALVESEPKKDWMKVAKYKLAAFFSYHASQPLPPCPFDHPDKPGHLLGGGKGRWLLKMLKDPSQKFSLLASIKQTKKGMPRPTAEQLKIAEQDFIKEMTQHLHQEKPGCLFSWSELTELPDDYPIEVNLNRETVKVQIDRTVNEIFRGKIYDLAERVKPFFPSTSANYINSRSGLGAIGTILENPDLLEGLRSPGGAQSLILEKPNSDEDEIEDEVQTPISVTIDPTELNYRFEILWKRLLELAVAEAPNVKPVALSEALKIRMITKGPPYLQTVLRSLWKFLHTTLRHNRVFRLIGTPATEEIILDVLGRNLNEGEAYLSGDYANATNELHSWVSEAVADAVARELKLKDEELILLKTALTGHIFPGGLPQKRGQLMGSIVSFPVLCIANAALCRWAMELSESKPIQLSQAPLLINGDDAALRAKSTVYHFWRRITGFCGLKESLGKTYLSKNFVEINSTIFERKEEPKLLLYPATDRHPARERPTHLYQVKYVNAGLLIGLKRSQGSIGLNDQDSPYNNLASRARQLISHAPADLHEKVMKAFISFHHDILTKSRLPWYIPDWLGGLGLPHGSWGEPSELDLRLAHLILLNWQKERPIPLGHKETPWKLWMKAQARLPAPLYSQSKGKHTEVYEKAIGLEIINFLFDSAIDTKDIYEKTVSDEARVSRAIKKNSRLWKPKAGKLPTPLSIEDLQFTARHPNWIIGDSFKVRNKSLGAGLSVE